MEEKVGLQENLVIFSLEFSDNPVGFLVFRIRRFLVEYDSIYIYIFTRYARGTLFTLLSDHIT